MAEQADRSIINPWMGLVGYEEGQTLYGRDNEITILCHLISESTAIVVYGKSGIGKSSLLKAGVFPELRNNQMLPIYLRLKHNTEESYVLQIENQICKTDGICVRDLLPSDIPDLGLWDFLHRHEITDMCNQPIMPVIVLDQFEEIYTLTDSEHKSVARDFFIELADVLNDTKPDRVIEAERKYSQENSRPIVESQRSGFMFKPISKSTLKYRKDLMIRIVICLRDDSLYMLERNSATIPALKANRYNLEAFSEDAAKEVIMKPCLGFFTEKKCNEIIERLSDESNDGRKIVDPAILSLFLYLYYENGGETHYDEIFSQYYEQSIKDLKENTVSYLEDNLITEGGFRCQVRADELYGKNEERKKDVDRLHMDFHILKAERQNGIKKYEYSHDRICLAAKKNKEERLLRKQNKKMRMRIAIMFAFMIAIVASVFGGQYYERLSNNDGRIYSESERQNMIELVRKEAHKTNCTKLCNYIDTLLKLDINKKMYTEKDRLEWLNKIMFEAKTCGCRDVEILVEQMTQMNSAKE